MFVPGLRQLLTLHEANLVRAWKTSVYNFGGLGIIEARGRVILFWNARSVLESIGAPAASSVRRSTSPTLIDRRIASRNVEAR
jgi:hypothetical protein